MSIPYLRWSNNWNLDQLYDHDRHMFFVTSHPSYPKSKSYRPFLFTISLSWISSTPFVQFVSPKWTCTTPCFSLFHPTSRRRKISTISGPPIQIKSTIDFLELRDLPWWETLQDLTPVSLWFAMDVKRLHFCPLEKVDYRSVFDRVFLNVYPKSRKMS